MRTAPTGPPWMRTQQVRAPAPLAEGGRADVCVIGAGIAGITTAYLLAQAGKRVIVLENRTIGGGESGRTTAHLSNALDDRYYKLERLHGSDGTRLAAASHTAAIDFIESTVRAEQIDCDFERLDGYLFVPPGESSELLDQELEAARRAGLVEVERLPRAPLSSFDTGACLRFPRQGQFHPLAYLNALAAVIERTSGSAIRRAHVTGVESGPPAEIATAEGWTITADAVVCTTNAPIIDRLAIHSKQAPYRTFVIGARVARGSVPRALYWDTADPYHYVRLHDDLVIVGGEDHKTGQQDDGAERLRRLEAWTQERFPIGAVEFRWSGQVLEPVDGLAYIGRNPGDWQHIFVATGDSGQGMTHGTIAGILIRDLMLGHPNPWEKLYDPSRKSLRSVGEYVRENVNVAGQYADHVTPGEVNSEADIDPGTGAVVREGLKKFAVSRDDTGVRRRVSAVCTHLGCIVRWNSLEQSWDCPCHGSRFGPDGQVLNSPAVTGLETNE